MFLEESIRIGEILEKIDLKKDQLVVDIGSSSDMYRRLHQPFIDYYVFSPLRKRGLRIIYVDSREDEGVDIVWDVASAEATKSTVKMERADVVICANFLEHVLDRDLVMSRVKALTKQDGVIVITVPHVYRYHAHPIDTMYRPTNAELEALFPKDGYTIKASEMFEIEAEPTIIDGGNWILRGFNRIRRRLYLGQPKPPRIVRNEVSLIAVKKLSSRE